MGVKLKYVPLYAVITIICLLLVYSFFNKGKIGIFNREMDVRVVNLEVEPYQTGSKKSGDLTLPLHRVKVRWDLVSHRGQKGSVKIVVSLSYIDMTFDNVINQRHRAAPDQEFDIFLDVLQKEMEADFEIYDLAEMLHYGDTHLSTLEAKIFMVDRHGDLKEIMIMSMLDGYFEGMSGWRGTGITVVDNG